MSNFNGLTVTQQMMSSCTGGLITAVFMTPFDVVKVRLQTQQRALLKSRCFLYCNGLMDHLCNCATVHPTNGYSNNHWYNRPISTHLNGTVDAFIKISRTEGFKSLWSGLPPTLIVAIPNTIIYLTSYEKVLKTIRQQYYPLEQPIWAGGVAGGIARSWAVTMFSPLELLRTKIQSKNISYKDVFTVLIREIKTAGPKTLWRGWTPTVLRDVPFSVIYWMTYENLKLLANQNHPSIPYALFAGATAGGFAGLVTLPLDVVKTHQQIEIGEKELFSEKPKGVAGNTRSMLIQIYSQQGLKGLFTGVVPRLAKVMPACAIMITSYEYAKSYFRQRNELKEQR
ncbi:UNVERIFIED_CONTAM: hypothetical protein RMT77_011245 [Armadillidium vulgare]